MNKSMRKERALRLKEFGLFHSQRGLRHRKSTRKELAKIRETLGDTDFEDFVRFQTCTPQERVLIRNRIAERHLGLIGFVAQKKKWERHIRDAALDVDDLRSEGFIGLSKAVEVYDFTLGANFATFAVYYIEAEIRRSLANQGVVRIPESRLNQIYQLRQARRHLQQKYGASTNSDQIQELLGWSDTLLEDVLCAEMILHHRAYSSAQQKKIATGSNGTPLSAFEQPLNKIPDICWVEARQYYWPLDRHSVCRQSPEMETLRSDLQAKVRQIQTQVLTPEQQCILLWHYDHEIPVSEIGRRLQLTGPGASQRMRVINSKLHRALRKLL